MSSHEGSLLLFSKLLEVDIVRKDEISLPEKQAVSFQMLLKYWIIH